MTLDTGRAVTRAEFERQRDLILAIKRLHAVLAEQENLRRAVTKPARTVKGTDFRE
jgi:hypothetical protein